MAKNQAKDVDLEEQENTEEIQTIDKPKFGQKMKTAGENFKLDVELFWARNKKKVLVGTGLLTGAALGILGLKKLSEDGILYDEDGSMVYESDDSEIQEAETDEPSVDSEGNE